MSLSCGHDSDPLATILAGALLPAIAAIPAAVLILISSALYFADRRMKTADNYFRGFPALWNVVAFYLFLLRPEPWLSLAIVVALCAAMFLPFAYLHPLRVARWRGVSIVLLLAWSALAASAILQDMEPGIFVKLSLVALAVYFCTAGLVQSLSARA